MNSKQFSIGLCIIAFFVLSTFLFSNTISSPEAQASVHEISQTLSFLRHVPLVNSGWLENHSVEDAAKRRNQGASAYIMPRMASSLRGNGVTEATSGREHGLLRFARNDDASRNPQSTFANPQSARAELRKDHPDDEIHLQEGTVWRGIPGVTITVEKIHARRREKANPFVNIYDIQIRIEAPKKHILRGSDFDSVARKALEANPENQKLPEDLKPLGFKNEFEVGPGVFRIHTTVSDLINLEMGGRLVIGDSINRDENYEIMVAAREPHAFLEYAVLYVFNPLRSEPFDSASQSELRSGRGLSKPHRFASQSEAVEARRMSELRVKIENEFEFAQAVQKLDMSDPRDMEIFNWIFLGIVKAYQNETLPEEFLRLFNRPSFETPAAAEKKEWDELFSLESKRPRQLKYKDFVEHLFHKFAQGEAPELEFDEGRRLKLSDVTSVFVDAQIAEAIRGIDETEDLPTQIDRVEPLLYLIWGFSPRIERALQDYQPKSPEFNEAVPIIELREAMQDWEYVNQPTKDPSTIKRLAILYLGVILLYRNWFNLGEVEEETEFLNSEFDEGETQKEEARLREIANEIRQIDAELLQLIESLVQHKDAGGLYRILKSMESAHAEILTDVSGDDELPESERQRLEEFNDTIWKYENLIKKALERIRKGGSAGRSELRSAESGAILLREEALEKYRIARARTYRAAIHDIDGNITIPGTVGVVSPEASRIILEHAKRGIPQVLASGRTEFVPADSPIRALGSHDIKEVAGPIRRELPDETRHLLMGGFENGSFIYWYDAENHRHEVDLVRHFNIVPEHFIFTDAEQKQMYLEISDHLARNGFPDPFTHPEFKRYGIAGWIKHPPEGRGEIASRMAREIQKFLDEHRNPKFRLFQAQATSVAVDIMVKGVNRGLIL